jgi:hypothetical protein
LGFSDYVCDTYLNAIELLRDPSHVRDFTLAEWETFFAGASFELEVVFPYRIFLDFEEWTERMATPQASRVSIRALYDVAPAEVKTAMGIVEEGHSLQCAVLRGRISE